MKTLLTLAATAAVLALAGQAAASELIVNGGFEIGDTSGWTKVADLPSTPDSGYTTGFNYVSDASHTGVFSMQTGNYPYQGLAGLSQQVFTVAGDSYDISLWWRTTGFDDSSELLYQVLWDGAVVGQVVGNETINDYVNLTYQVTGTGADTLTFKGYSQHGYNLTDDVSVTGIAGVNPGAGGSGGAVPEPASWALMIGGFGLAGAALRRRRAGAVIA